MDRDDPALPDISFGFPSDVPIQLDTSFVAMIHDAARESRDLTMAVGEAEAAEDEVPTEDDEAAADAVTATPTPSVPPSVAVSISGPPTDHSIPDTLSNLTNAVQSHEARLNKLENPSFCPSTASVSASFAATQAHEECIERHDHMDMRVTELESRLGEVERAQMNNDNDTATVTASSVVSVSASGAPLSTTASIVSRTPRTTSATDPAILNQLEALQERVSLLQQAALPSPSRPWQIEVVFLPFPLKGIWVEPSQFGSSGTIASANAAQRRQRGTTPSIGDADGEDEWMQTTLRADTPRLLPRACMPGRDIERRLRSRGLVQTVTVRGADAHSLHMAMVTAFGPLLRQMSSNNTTAANKSHRRSSSVSVVSQFLGLQQSWVPLRKVHKESRLRLLKRSEMLTPAVWDVGFMTASVVMKASGLHRLFVTQPGAYLQNRDAYTHGWSWQRLLRLISVFVAASDQQSTPSSFTVAL
ncbi:hypothetical protein SCUCBS95973_004855 [Sporothrix curviconia]|uniref:GPI-anchored surface protein n=1 Tax=Sporothrix curviconia TaxID=1260050 RepID=A0ABP0BTL6_9PEZI